MSLTLGADLTSRILLPARPARGLQSGTDSAPVFVDAAGQRARWCRRLLASCALVALMFLVTVTIQGVALARAAGCHTGNAPARPGDPSGALMTPAATPRTLAGTCTR
jgi:hypothetical protein